MGLDFDAIYIGIAIFTFLTPDGREKLSPPFPDLQICKNWHPVWMPRRRFTSGRRGGKISIFGPFSGDFVTCLMYSYMAPVTCDRYKEIRKILGLWPVTYELN